MESKRIAPNLDELVAISILEIVMWVSKWEIGYMLVII